jgi:hypothetical protein
LFGLYRVRTVVLVRCVKRRRKKEEEKRRKKKKKG